MFIRVSYGRYIFACNLDCIQPIVQWSIADYAEKFVNGTNFNESQIYHEDICGAHLYWQSCVRMRRNLSVDSVSKSKRGRNYTRGRVSWNETGVHWRRTMTTMLTMTMTTTTMTTTTTRDTLVTDTLVAYATRLLIPGVCSDVERSNIASPCWSLTTLTYTYTPCRPTPWRFALNVKPL